jgi:HlyD family secretion protein
MARQLDLRELANPRGTVSSAARGHGGGGRWLSRFVLPMVLLLGFAGALAYSFREIFLTAHPVKVVPVMAVQAEITESEAPLFQSAGWVEPRPTPVLVTALAEGIVEQLLVIEGQDLRAGETVARLIDADAQLRVQDAAAELSSRQAEMASKKASLIAAETRLREPLEWQTKLAEAEAMLARIGTERARLPGQIAAAESKLTLAGKELESRRNSTDVLGKLALARAENEHQVATAVHQELLAQKTTLEQEQAANDRRVKALQRQLELKTEELRERDEALAAVDLAEAKVRQANVMVEAAKLNLNRMTVKAPTAGRVQALIARPGSKVMGQTAASAPEASTVITMYDPARLQVRADVRLEEVPRVFVGQQARIETPAVAGALDGEVIATTSITDIQKNTLQVKVAVLDPPAVLKPDMLVQVTFLSPQKPKAASETVQAHLTLVIPPELVQQEGNESRVWIANQQRKVAELRAVTLGGLTRDGFREIKQGLSIGDRLIVSGAESLRVGDRIRIAGEGAGSSRPTSHDPNSHGAHKMKRL